MEIKPSIKNITIFPVKSLDGIGLQKAQIGNGGSLLHDREFAIVDDNQKYLNGKSTALVHHLTTNVDFENELIFFNAGSGSDSFHILHDKISINDYLSAFFNKPVKLERNTEGKFLDVPVKSGITVLSTASLQTVAGWFNNLPVEETRERFRANIEIEGVPPFWEDQLFFSADCAVEFSMGDVILYGMGPRARCVVPTRHPQTGALTQMFQKSFAIQRDASLPDWSSLENYGHRYYLSVDCYVPPTEFGKWIKVGDEIKITGNRRMNERP